MRIFTFLLFFISLQAMAEGKLNQIKIGDNSYQAYGLLVTPDEDKAYITLKKQGFEKGVELDIIDLHTQKLSKRIQFDEDNLFGQMFLSADNTKLYLNFAHWLYVLDTQTYEILKKIEFKENHSSNYGVAVSSPDKTRLYYKIQTSFSSGPDYILVIDSDRMEPVDTLSPNTQEVVQVNTSALLIDPDGKTLYELPQTHWEKPIDQIQAIDLQTKQYKTLSNLPNSAVLGGLILSPDGNTFYESAFEENGYDRPPVDFFIYAIDKNTMSSREIYYTEHYILIKAVSPSGQYLYINDGHERHPGLTKLDIYTGKAKKIYDEPISSIVCSQQTNSQRVYFVNGQRWRSNLFSIYDPEDLKENYHG